MIQLSGISFIATYNCNAHCRHCFFDTSAAYSYMSPELIERVYEDTSVFKKQFWNHISGGEVMLEPDTLYEIIRTIRKNFSGDIGISTNGTWALSPEIAEQRIQELKDAGVSGIAVSADTFHDEYIQHNKVKYAVDAISRSGLTRHSYLMKSRCHSDILQAQAYNFLSEKLAQKLNFDANIPIAEPYIRSIGKGSLLNVPKKNVFSSQAVCTELSECLGKRGLFNPAMVYVDVYGNVMICYGVIIGNVFQTPFAKIISDFSVNQHKLISNLARSPHNIYVLAQKYKPGISEKFYDVCDMCYLSRKSLRKIYPEVFGPSECYP